MHIYICTYILLYIYAYIHKYRYTYSDNFTKTWMFGIKIDTALTCIKYVEEDARTDDIQGPNKPQQTKTFALAVTNLWSQVASTLQGAS